MENLALSALPPVGENGAGNAHQTAGAFASPIRTAAADGSFNAGWSGTAHAVPGTVQATETLQAGPWLPTTQEHITRPVTSFASLVNAGLEQVNRQLIDAQTSLQKLALGQAPSLHQVMMSLEESRLSFQIFMQVRNRLLESYQEVMRMQI